MPPTTHVSATSWRWLPLKPRPVLVLLVLHIFVGFWLGSTVLLELRGSGNRVPGSRPFMWEFSGALATWVCIWLPMTAALNAPRPNGRWARFFAIHLTAFIAFDALKNTLMLGARFLLYPIFGWGEYRYGTWGLQLAMEAMKDGQNYFLIATGYSLFRVWRDRQAQSLREAKLATELKEARLQSLLGQLNPHFLFNALNAISSLMYQDLTKTDRLLSDLGLVLRASFESDQPTWSLSDERAHTERFGALLEARFGDRVRVHWSVDPAVETAQIPRFSFQLLLENAVKHNQDRLNALDVRLTARIDGGSLVLEVEDTGRGFGERSPASGAGLGLKHLEQALDLLHGNRARLERGVGREGGARVRMILPRDSQ